MLMGPGAPAPSVVETVTGSPFGAQLLGGTLPFFDPYGWTPETGVDDALTALGWAARTTGGGDAEAALDRLASHLADGPVVAGPVEMGHLRHQPGRSGPVGADHYVVVLDADEDGVTLHDPGGHPYARLPIADFMAAWRAEDIEYGDPFTLRSNFTRISRVLPEEAIESIVPRAVSWLGPENGDAVLALADRVADGCDPALREHLADFAIRVGARRLTDAAACLRGVGRDTAAGTLTRQARLLGSLQYPVATGDDRAAARILRALAPTYGTLRDDLGRRYG
ncbi:MULTISPECIES: hypothetical protein [Nocardiopsidaceae]|uniref:Peptidase C39-like domain-containing protein n=1 Tax=Streptomonospora nanhaiensis TaxID=1323731 RepID=A0ABY6YV83_9ACTN|nr:hypothetical protein [Streptomonospora nanhaiensis]WAE76098.1 hypothetical protein OUQ99_13890 [Streptomonospora nanhaiensis]